MIDIRQDPALEIFTPRGATAWQVWNKPRGAQFVVIWAIGAGGGGGGGFTQTTPGTQAGGGGSGGGGSTTKLVYPASMLPDRLFLLLALGGNGGAPGGNGTSGGANTFVSTYPDSLASLLGSGVAVAGGGTLGSAGTATAGGVLGGGGSVVTLTTTLQSGVMSAVSFVGVGGNVGGSNGAGVVRNIEAASMATSGTSGAGVAATPVAAAGGSITQIGADYSLSAGAVLVPGGLGNASGSGSPGANGFARWDGRLMFLGGAGGGNAAGSGAVFGGDGGNASYGCGGGGGGGASGGAGSAGGRGGRGGDAIVLIWTY